METTTVTGNYPFLRGGGEMGERTRTHDWGQTALGTPDTWPVSLRATLGIVLHSAFPMFLFWGDDLTCFYNDAYRPSLGDSGKHPALGQPGRTVWPEIWDFLSPHLERVMATGESVRYDDQLVPIFRNGALQDVYWTFSYSPVFDESSQPAGVLVTCMETTEKVVATAALQASEQLLQNVVRDTSVGLIVLSGETLRVDVVNDAYARLIDRRREDLLGKPLYSVIPEAEATFRPIIDGVRQTGEPAYFYGEPYSVQNAGGATVTGFLNLVYQPYRDKNGTITGVVVQCQDVTRQTEAEQKQHESDERFRLVVELSPVALAIFDGPQFVITLANDSVLEFWGRQREQVMDKPLFEALPEASKQGFEELLTGVYTTGQRFETKEATVMLERQGKLEQTYFDFTYEAIRTPNGTITGVMVVCVETTGQVLARKAVEANESLFRSLIQEAPVAMMLLTGPNHVIELANEGMTHMLGKGQAILGKPAVDAVPELAAQTYLHLLDTVFASGETHQEKAMPGQLVTNGVTTHHYFDFTYKSMRRATGEVYGIMSMAVDVTAQVLARQRTEQDRTDLLEINQRLSLALDAGNLGSFALDRDTGIMLCTPQCKANHGQVPDAAPSSYAGLIGLIVADDRDGVSQAMAHAFETQTTYQIDYRIVWPDGSLHWVRASGQPVYSPDGPPARLVGITQNITAQRMAREELEQQVQERTRELEAANQDLQRSNENLQQFAYVASHDLQEPLRKIQSFGNVLVDQYGPQLGEGADLLRRMQSAAGRMSTLISDLLTYSRIATRQDTSLPVALSQVVERVLTDLELVIQETGAVLHIGELPTVAGDPVQLGQLMQNLLTNALKFRRAGNPPAITVRAWLVATAELPAGVRPLRQVPCYHRLDVTDNGIGFEEKYVERIFQVFQRLHGRGEFAGTGIGLAICEKVAANHGGAITARSQPGQGATFSVFLPQ